jgi:hypothetical protein
LALVGLVLLLRLLLLLGFLPCKQLLGSIAWRAAAFDAAAAAGLSLPECSACRYCCKAADEYAGRFAQQLLVNAALAAAGYTGQDATLQGMLIASRHVPCMLNNAANPKYYKIEQRIRSPA